MNLAVTRRAVALSFLALAIALSAVRERTFAQTPAQLSPQNPAQPVPSVLAQPPVPGAVAVPWAVGESFEYTVKLAGMTSGSGIMQVLAIDSTRGRPTWRLHFNIKGSALKLYHVDDSYDSWMDVATLNSLRFEQHLYEGGKKTQRINDIFPDRKMFHREGRDEEPSVANPLDDASFFFFIRTVPLEVGQSYTFNQYFEPKANPVIINVIRKDTIDVPAGRFPAIVIDPRIKTNGLFSDHGHAEIWLSDDSRRMMLKMHSSFSAITLDLSLKKATFGGAPSGSATGRKR